MNPHHLPSSPSAAVPESEPLAHVSPAKQTANQANAQLSRGPKTPEGKAKSSLNTVKTGLTGRTVLLSSDDAAAYQQHVRDYEKELRPVGQRECDLAQSIADSAWRLSRVSALEMAIYAQGHTQFATQFDHEDVSTRPALIELHTFLFYEKQLRNLHLQEARLHRRREKDTAEFRQLQSERRNRDTDTLEAASRLYMQAKRANKPFDPSELGFEFSTSDIEAYKETGSVLEIGYSAFKRRSDVTTGSVVTTKMQTAA
jgi:hypothetical protein